MGAGESGGTALHDCAEMRESGGEPQGDQGQDGYRRIMGVTET